VCALSLAVWAAEEEDPFFNAPKLVVAEPDPVTLGLSSLLFSMTGSDRPLWQLI